MCGHGTIGVVATLATSGAISPGSHRLETPVGEITFLLHNNHRVSMENMPSYRYRKEVPVYVDASAGLMVISPGEETGFSLSPSTDNISVKATPTT